MKQPSSMNAESRDPSMKLLSLNVDLPREVSWSGQKVRTGIFSESLRHMGYVVWGRSTYKFGGDYHPTS